MIFYSNKNNSVFFALSDHSFAMQKSSNALSTREVRHIYPSIKKPPSLDLAADPVTRRVDLVNS
jgi:hypothetical protein